MPLEGLLLASDLLSKTELFGVPSNSQNHLTVNTIHII